MISKIFYFIIYIFIFYFILKLVRQFFTKSPAPKATGNVFNSRRPQHKFENIEEAQYTIIEEKKKEDRQQQ